ncbi:hypothetical protein, partial [Hyphomonas atlantica]|uniref:hypothetical protein n=1 Tax=Hyphomonas atlantica TaxID=1280948 RepID=UPI003511C17A
GCGVRDRMGLEGGVRSRTALGRSGQGELAKASWAVEDQESCQWHDFARQASSSPALALGPAPGNRCAISIPPQPVRRGGR